MLAAWEIVRRADGSFRSRAVAALACTAAVAAGAVLAVGGERLAHTAIVGSAQATVVPAIAQEPTVGLVGDRASRLGTTWFRPSYQGPGLVDFMLATGVAVIVVIALLVRLGRRSSIVVGLAGAVAAAYLVRSLAGEGPVPGLVVAFPVAWAALWLLDRRALTDERVLLVAIAAGLAVAGIAAAQYREGGGLEWGGRYFLVALPVAAPVVMAGLTAGARRLPRRRRGPIAVVMLVVVVALAAAAVTELRLSHRRAEAFAGRLAAATATLPHKSQVGDGRPIVLTTARLLPQIIWPDFDRYQWLVVSAPQLPEYLDRLAASRVQTFVFVPASTSRDLPLQPEAFDATLELHGDGVPPVLVYERAGAD